VASQQDLIKATACAVVDQLNAGTVTPLDLLDALEARIKEVDGQVNALPILCFDRARDHAKELMKKPLGERGILAGLPVPIKDLTVRRRRPHHTGIADLQGRCADQVQRAGRAPRRKRRRDLCEIQHA
jgi:Asp-tRNA(Asn)/Glu-tRNA(Gln) amidotransferase A subunit family amidase